MSERLSSEHLSEEFSEAFESYYRTALSCLAAPHRQEGLCNAVLEFLEKFKDKSLFDTHLFEEVKVELARFESHLDHNHFCDLVTLLRRVEQQILLEEEGIDYLTRLGNMRALTRDFKTEMDRLARRGAAFSMALVKLDYEDETLSLEDPAARAYVAAVAYLIRDCLRTFDGAYRIGPDEFILFFQQADIPGGVSALERLGESMEELGKTLEVDGRSIPLHLQSCVAEPDPSDNLDDLLSYLRSDLKKGVGEGERIVEHQELSPLQRYLSDQES